MFGVHAADGAAVECVGHARVDRVAVGAEGVGAGIEEDLLEGFEVEVGFAEDGLEVFHDGRVTDDRAGGFAGAFDEFVDWFEETDAHDAFPHAVGDEHGEARVSGVGDPLGEFLAAVVDGFWRAVAGAWEEGFGFDEFVWFAAFSFEVHGELDDSIAAAGDAEVIDVIHEPAVDLAFFGVGVFVFPVVLFVDEFFAFVAGACVHAVGEGGHFVEVRLFPLIVGVVVALGALDVSTEEDARGVGHVVERHATVAFEVADGSLALFPAAA